MSRSGKGLPEILEKGRPLQVGFIPDADCAPLIFARESGLFEKYELDVDLHRETTWANIRDKVIQGDLDATQAPATLPFVANLGLDSDQCACVAGLVLNLHGCAITVSRELWDQGVREADTLRDLVYRNWGRRTYTFGVVFPYSPPYFLLRQWLAAGGFVGREVRIVVLPSAQMFPTLRLGYIDGYCAGEPWTSLAVEAGAGACVASSGDLAPLHPGKVLMVRRDFALERAGEHERLAAALLEACVFCDQPGNRPLLADMLSQAHYVNAPADCLKPVTAETAVSTGAPPRGDAGGNIFHRYNANDPTVEKAEWLVSRLYDLIDESILKYPLIERTPMFKNVFRRDIFDRARALVRKQARATQAEAENYTTA